MEDILQVNNQLYIRASSSLTDQRNRVIKHGEVFAVFDVHGDLRPIGTHGVQGIYKETTRYLSQMELRLGGRYPLFLSSTIKSDNSVLTVDLSNSDLYQTDGTFLPKGSLHCFRSKFLLDDACYEEIEITNFTHERLQLELSLKYGADFIDMFEIRGIVRDKRGNIQIPHVENDSVTFSYEGLDQKSRCTLISFYPMPHKLTASEAVFLVDTLPQAKMTFYITTTCHESQTPSFHPVAFHSALSRVESLGQSHISNSVRLTASSERFNSWLKRSQSDLSLMSTETTVGPYPYAGIPWFNAVFGRDGIITALQSLWVQPELAKGVLSYLALHQAKEDLPEQDAEPGKILHEFRRGEMVETGEVPFKTYYGSADSTPLFVILAGHYLEHTADLHLIRSIWPNIQAAMKWIEKYGDLDGDGFIEYSKRTPKGLLHQGWKDSVDPISHSSGQLAEGPIALVEVQAYAYEARTQAAKIAGHLGFHEEAQQWMIDAKRLKENFHEKFWRNDLQTYALALDGQKSPCDVISSNAGHALFAGITDKNTARKVMNQLMSDEMFSGWGIRTLSKKAIRYNPMSYHNGSVWPHDCALIAQGFARYGFKSEVLRVLNAVFDSAMHMDLYRLPELYCGFSRRPGEGPTLYPVACSPQSWAAGSALMLLKSALGLTIDGFANQITFYRPVLPNFLTDLRIENLRTPNASVDLMLRRHGDEVSVYVEKRMGDVEINIVK